MMHQLLSLAPLLLVLLLTGYGVNSSDITQNVFGDIKEGVIAAFGDFNSDELTDVFIIRDNMHTLQILYNEEAEPLLKIGPYCQYPQKIASVIPGDFNGDALMDVLVTLRRNDDDDIYDVRINWGNGTALNCSKRSIITTKGEPMALDYNRDMIIDLYGYAPDLGRSFWIFNTSGIPDARRQVSPTGNVLTEFSIPNANAYLDLNKDNVADLVVQTDKFYEVWNGRKDDVKDFTYNRSINFHVIGNKDYTLGQAVFMDFELEGVQNLVLPVCIQKDCSNSSILVYDGNDFRDIHVTFRDPQGASWGFVPPIADDVYLKTITARSGDFNMDGYPDLIVTLQPLNRNKKVTQTFLLENVACKTCNKPLKRTFEVRWNDLYPMGNNTVAGAFYDFYQDGILDVILIEKDAQGQYRPLAFRNTLDYDANFVKVIVLTGLVNAANPAPRSPLGRKRRTYGTNLPGPSITYSTTTQEGDHQSGSSAQLAQSSYFALQLPFTIFGLGRTPNFVDSLTVGLDGKKPQWKQLIPNSQIYVVPNPIDDSTRWKAQLFVTPSKLIVKSVVALGITCLVIVLIILVLYIKEKREDRQERLQETHRFHYDAM